MIPSACYNNRIPQLQEWRRYLDHGCTILSNAQLREADRLTGERLPSLLLMEQAAQQVCRYLEQCPAPFLLLVGPGNNGGDALAVARMLLSRNVELDLWFFSSEPEWRGDSASNYQFLLPLLEPTVGIYHPLLDPPWQRYRCVIDGLFGSGLNRPLSSPYPELLQHVNSLKALRIAIDIPSGLQGDSPLQPACCFKADATIAIYAARPAQLLYPAASSCGLLHIAPIGIDQQSRAASRASQLGSWRLLGKTQLQLPARSRDSHKGSYGHVLLVGGCQQSLGAIRMAAAAALRSGVGMVTIAADSSLLAQLAATTTDVQLLELPTTLASSAMLPDLQGYSAVLIGCGWGRAKQRQQLLEQLLHQHSGKLILDADALYALAQAPQLLPLLKDRSLLTPHLGEFATLNCCNKEELLLNYLQAASSYACQHQLTLLLKSSTSLLCSANADNWVINRGNEALARGGSGDNLAGLIAGLVAQGCPLLQAAQIGAWVIGRAAELALANGANSRCLLSSQLSNYFGSAFDEIEALDP